MYKLREGEREREWQCSDSVYFHLHCAAECVCFRARDVPRESIPRIHARWQTWLKRFCAQHRCRSGGSIAFRFSEYSPNNDGNDDDDDGGDNDDEDNNNSKDNILLFHIPRDQLHRYYYYVLQRLRIIL